MTLSIRVSPDRQPEKTITVTAGPRARWAINLASKEHGIIRMGENVNVGGTVEADGRFVAFMAIWNSPTFGPGTMDDSDPLPLECQE